MLLQEIICKKWDGGVFDKDEIVFFVCGFVDGFVIEGQVFVFVMVVFFKGLIIDECVVLMLVMCDSGDVFDWFDVDVLVFDKYLIGGVGDNVFLMFVLVLVICGVVVLMIFGCGFGYIGGIFDKFDSILGYQIQLDNVLFKKVVKEVGCVVIGQIGNFVLVDKWFYVIRDVMVMVESIDLIIVFILFKKLVVGF